VSTSIRSLVDKFFSLKWCIDNIVVPIEINRLNRTGDEVITVAVANFAYLATIGNFIKKRVEKQGLNCQFIEKTPDEIKSLLDQASTEMIITGKTIDSFYFGDDSVLEALKEVDDQNEGENRTTFEFDESDEELSENNAIDLGEEMQVSQIQKAAGTILINSWETNVSDIHLEPTSDSYRVRVRRDGVMQSFVAMPKSAGTKLIACLKNMAGMDIAERRASQDGKILRKYSDKVLEFRCSTAPTKYNEKMVLRLLNSNIDMLNLDLLIDDQIIRDDFRDVINEANGIVIVTGPTGSGKSTTLAAALRERDNGELNIVTAEDPIEYDLGGCIQQFPVLRAKGQSFANLLRTFLRQDPDIILIGETRDPETAESSMDAAETGHLVFTTLHANNAASTLTRLMDMGVPSYKLISSMRGILAQRLLRKVCIKCSIEREITESESAFSGIKLGTIIKESSVLSATEKEFNKKTGTLCDYCGGSGYKGRVGAYELLKLTQGIREAISSGKTSQQIEIVAADEGMMTLKRYGAKLVEKQLTTMSELIKMCNTEH